MIEEEKMHIILADDDEDDRNVFKQAIEELGLNIDLTIYKSGDELLDYLYEPATVELPHILFLDLNMLCTKYDDCLKDIRKNAKFQDMSIAIYSTSTSEKDIQETFIGGANIYINKPNDFEVLKKSLREVLKINWQFHTSGLSKDTFLFSI
ncbi:response regulator [Flavobacterium qiangtangense]|uniref:Response regulator n=1 Tax=Flavobacterium qiangtangense TaxID=1442595 RepID=A0ABW1PR54_9FLAO